MRLRWFFAIGVAGLALFVTCVTPCAAQNRGTLYTAYNIWYEHPTKIYSTNYQRGAMIPAGTAVTIVDISRRTVEFEVNSTGARYRVIWIAKAIKKGEVRPGMSRNAVLISWGYPPEVRTPELTLSDWTYWKSRFDTVMVRFEGGSVSEVVD